MLKRTYSVVEDLQAAARRNLANSGWMKLVRVVAVPTLYKDGTVAEAFGINFASNVVQMNACKVKSLPL